MTSSASSTQPPEHHAIVDARGQACPIPILWARLQSKAMDDGDVLQVLATDAGTKRDFQTFVEQTGHELLHVAEDDGEYRFWIRIR